MVTKVEVEFGAALGNMQDFVDIGHHKNIAVEEHLHRFGSDRTRHGHGIADVATRGVADDGSLVANQRLLDVEGCGKRQGGAIHPPSGNGDDDTRRLGSGNCGIDAGVYSEVMVDDGAVEVKRK